MSKIITAQEAKQIFLSESFPQKGYFVVEMKKRPHILIVELNEYMEKLKKKREKLLNGKETTNLFQKIKHNLNELIH
jgi:hypothetical protein